jgi:hypothetical protein
MPSYFRQVPDFDYVSRDSEQRQISEYATVKNLFRRGKLREDIFGNLAFFTKYKIIGDERPDNVAYKIYNDETLDWVILLSNNILNIQTEWPLPQKVFDSLMLEKYETYDSLYNGIHHYETQEIKDSIGNLILPSGIKMPSEWKSGNGFIQGSDINSSNIVSIVIVDSNAVVLLKKTENITPGTEITINNSSNELINGSFVVRNIFTNQVPENNNYEFGFVFPIGADLPLITPIVITGNESINFISRVPIGSSNSYYYEYYDSNLQSTTLLSSASVLTPVTNYEYESQLEDAKRNIFVLKPRYLNIVFNDMEEIMKYKKGSSQYVSRTLKKGDNIRLYN